MSKLIFKYLTISVVIFYLNILFLLPFEWYKIGPYGEVFPAIDLIIIYYLSTHYKIKYWHLFIAGIFVDQLSNLPIGLSSLTFILGYRGLIFLSKWFLLTEHLTNLALFYVYSVIIILTRYLVVTIKSTYYIEGFSVFFYFLTTIFAYPIIAILIAKPFKIVVGHAR